jgi:uncharacterized protein (DUF1501 family)
VLSGACHCDEFARRQAAVPGRGLPVIERGMPAPAGTGLDRRAFLMRTAGLALAVYGIGRLPSFDEGIARAAAGPAQPVLVSIFLPGGADSLSVLYPDSDPLYRKLRPELALPSEAGPVFAEDNRLHWHPALKPFVDLHGEGKLTVFPAIGYTHPDQSHFTSRHFWEVGATSTQLSTGWLGRYLDIVGTQDNPLQGLSLDWSLQPALATSKAPVASLASPEDYSFWSPGVWGEVQERMLAAIGAFGAARRRDPALRQAASIAKQADRLRRQLKPLHRDDDSGYGSPVVYPNSDSGFPQRLAGLAAMLGGGLPMRCIALSAPGDYDTHSNQPNALAEGLEVTAASLAAFQRDLEARGLADRVVTLVWTEFGRRAEENGSSGTDHGAAGAAFLLGTRVRGQMIGEYPGLAGGLDEDGNLKPTSDFRAVYCALLEQWLGTDAARVIPNARAFDRPALVR